MTNILELMIKRPFMQKKNAKLLAENTFLNEGKFVNLNGKEQWITIRGTNFDNPILLIVHGGPGSSYIPFNSQLIPLEKHFTIVQWDQMGAGQTFERNGKDEHITFDSLQSDGIALVEYLKKEYGKDKIVLMGSSAGSLIALKMIHKSPTNFYAYVGVNQNAPDTGHFYHYILNYVKNNPTKDNRFVLKLDSDKTKWTEKEIERVTKLALSADKKSPNMIFDIMMPAMMYAPDYTMKDMKLMEEGMKYANDCLWYEMNTFNFSEIGHHFALPFLILQGESDELTPVEDAKSYLEQIKAPIKEMYLIPKAGHLAEFANPQAFQNLMIEKVLPLIN